MLLLVKALNVMYVGVPSGGIISSIIPLAFKTTANLWSLINIISLEEQRKMSHGKNKLLLFDEMQIAGLVFGTLASSISQKLLFVIQNL